MPRRWIYFIALFFLLVIHVLVMDTRFFLEWLWYSGYQEQYHLLNALSVNERAVEMFGGWPLVVFVLTVFYYWIDHVDEDNTSNQFVILPLLYAPFLIVGNALVERSFDFSTLYMYPLIVIPAGYLYVFPWVLFVWVFSKLRLVV